MVFDIIMEDLRREADLVAIGYVTLISEIITYSSVIIRETVHIFFTMVVLRDQEVKAADLLNVQMMAPNREKIWTVLGPEFGNDAGKSAIIVRALNGLKSTGASFRAHLAHCMKESGYESQKANPDCGGNMRPVHGISLSAIHTFYAVWMT